MLQHSPRRLPWVEIGVLANLLLLPSCAGETVRSEVRNVILVTLDTTRADVLEDERITPSLRRLASESWVFRRAYTVAPLTLPAHASIHTGLIPPRHGVRSNWQCGLPEPAQTLAETFAGEGFQTAAFVSAAVLDRSFGLDQGFDVYDQLETSTAESDVQAYRKGRETVGAAMRWLQEERDPERRFFLWVHLYDPHLPHTPAPEYLERARGNAYLAEVAEADDALGELLEAVAAAGLSEDTLLAVAADHGESLGEHGEPAHGALCYEAVLRVPLLIRFPGEGLPRAAATVTSLVDLYPTLLGAAGLPPKAGVDGIDLFVSDPARGAYFEAYLGWIFYGWSPLAGWIDGSGKYLASSRPELYDPIADPREEHDICVDSPERGERARRRLAELLTRPQVDSVAALPNGVELDAVAALGYLEMPVGLLDYPSALDPCDRRSPRDGAAELVPLTIANEWIRLGHYVHALEPLEAIVSANPMHLQALELYGLCLMHAGRFEDALRVLNYRAEVGYERADVQINRALCLDRLGDPDGALTALDAAEVLRPGEPQIAEIRDRCRRTSELSRSSR